MNIQVNKIVKPSNTVVESTPVIDESKESEIVQLPPVKKCEELADDFNDDPGFDLDVGDLKCETPQSNEVVKKSSLFGNVTRKPGEKTQSNWGSTILIAGLGLSLLTKVL